MEPERDESWKLTEATNDASPPEDQPGETHGASDPSPVTPGGTADVSGSPPESGDRQQLDWEQPLEVPIEELGLEAGPNEALDDPEVSDEEAPDTADETLDDVPLPVEVNPPQSSGGSLLSPSPAEGSSTMGSSTMGPAADEEGRPSTGHAAPNPGSHAAPTTSDSRRAPAADGGPAMVRPIVMVSLATEQLYAITDRALSSVRDREVKTIEQVADHKIKLAFWEFKCDQRAINRRTR